MAYTDPWTYTAEDVLQNYGRLEKPADLDPLIERIGNARYVLLGEASHGTHEYYTWRSAISKRLIEEKGFSFIAVEGDWPDCYRLNRFIKGIADGALHVTDILNEFRRWPAWMWANWEIAALAEWMKEYNMKSRAGQKTGFYGLDVYSLWESLEAMIGYLEKEDPAAANYAKQVFRCFEAHREEGDKYGHIVYDMSAACTEEVVRLLTGIRKKAPVYDHDPEAALNMEMNAQVVADADQYYRSMISFEERSWNIRDLHMVNALETLMKFHGENAKAIVWEHNTHIGDARATDMHGEGLWNVGQLVREQYAGEGVMLVGFGSYEGSVIAGKSWGAKMEKMPVPPAQEGSLEKMLHDDSAENKLIFSDNEFLRKRFTKWMGHRAIGVVYHPEAERGNYVPTILPARYDAFLYIDRTNALHPLHAQPDGQLVPDTYPFGI